MIISSLIIFGIALIICLFRLIKGPTTADRVVTFDTTSAVVMSISGCLKCTNGHRFFPRFNHAHCHYIFCSSVSISRFIGGGMCLMEITKEIFSLIAAVMLLLGGFIALY